MASRRESMIEAIEAVNGNLGTEPTPPVPPAKGSGTDGVVLWDVAHASVLEKEGMITQPDGSTAHPVQGGATETISQA